MTLAETAHYDEHYGDFTFSDPADPEALEALWVRNPYAPFNRDLLRLLGDLRDKSVLLLGNGVELMELHLLTAQPRRLIFSDISPEAVEAVRRHTRHLGATALEFRTVDAQAMPFADGEIDVVYGYAFAHHLPDLPQFLRETLRVLRPGGRAVFMDNATVPVWQFLKRTVLRWLMRASHRINPISAEDHRVTEEGWFSVDELCAVVASVGGRPFTARSGLLHYVVARVLQIVHRPQREWRGGEVRFHHERLMWALARADKALARLPFLRGQQIRLVWGFDKPSPP